MNKPVISLVGITVFAAFILAGHETPPLETSVVVSEPEAPVTTAALPEEVAPPEPASADTVLRERALAVGLKPLPSELPQPHGNTITPEKIELGQMLFFDPRLSASGVISCNSCHNVGTGGDDNMSTSVGHGWQTGARNSPTVFNAVFNIAQFWDGRAEDLKAQAKGPIQAGVEMANTSDQSVATIKSMPEYVERFTEVFPEESDAVSFDTITKAIEAFEVTLVTPNAPFDQFLNGDDDALSDTQKEGLGLFIQRGCTACHTGANIGGQAYFPFGLIQRPGPEILPPEDKGRAEVTGSPADEYVFRVAPLRNVALTAPYFHSGRVWDLRQAVSVMGAAQLGLELDEEEVSKIVAFLESLTGDMPGIEYPELPVETAGTPRPRL